jgi:PKD repeat protein
LFINLNVFYIYTKPVQVKSSIRRRTHMKNQNVNIVSGRIAFTILILCFSLWGCFPIQENIPTGINFSAFVGGENPPSQTVTVANSGAGLLTDIKIRNIVYTNGNDWLKPVPSLSSTSAPSTLTVNVLTGSLDEGTYYATIPIYSNAKNSPQHVNVSFVVGAPLSVTATASPVSGTMPLHVVFEGTATGGQTPYVWAWDLDGDGQYDDSTLQNPTNIYNDQGTYHVKMQVTDSLNNIGTSDVKEIIVNQIISSSISGSPLSGSVPLPVNFSGSASGGFPPYTWAWDLDSDGVYDDSTLQNPTKTFDIAGTYFIQAKVTDSQSNASNTNSITINAVDRLVATASASPTSGTAHLSVDFSGTTSGGLAPYTYAWDLDGNGVYDDSSSQNPSRTYTSGDVYSTRLRVTDALNTSAYSSRVPITVYEYGMRILSCSVWETDVSQKAYLNFSGQVHGASSSDLIKVVVGFRNSSGHWVGGDPVVTWSGVPGLNWISWDGVAFINLPSSSGTYNISVQNVATTSNSDAIQQFKDTVTTSTDEHRYDKWGTSITTGTKIQTVYFSVPIPDNGGSTNFAKAGVPISGLSSSSVVTGVDVEYDIDHTYVGDLKVWLTTYIDGYWRNSPLLRDRQGGSQDNIVASYNSGIATWNAAPANQTFYLAVSDNAPSDTGCISRVKIWVHWRK